MVIADNECHGEGNMESCDGRYAQEGNNFFFGWVECRQVDDTA